MLNKKRRIRRKSFGGVLIKGRRYNSPHLLMYINKSSADTPSRFSFSVSKKVAQKAVDRNKYRRRGYSVISRNIGKIKLDHFFVFSFKKGSAGLKFSELEKEILELLSISGMLK